MNIDWTAALNEVERTAQDFGAWLTGPDTIAAGWGLAATLLLALPVAVLLTMSLLSAPDPEGWEAAEREELARREAEDYGRTVMSGKHRPGIR